VSKKKKPVVKKSLGQIEVTANVDFLHNETKLNAQGIARMQQDIAGLRYLVGDLATRLAALESRPVQSASQTAPWCKTYFLGADTDAG
jgi:hypothetical protein